LLDLVYFWQVCYHVFVAIVYNLSYSSSGLSSSTYLNNRKKHMLLSP